MTIKVTKPAVNLREELTDLKQPYPIQGSVDGNDAARERLGIENHDQLTIGTDGVVDNFTSTGIDDNADATAITIDVNENVSIGTNAPEGSARTTISKARSSNTNLLALYGSGTGVADDKIAITFYQNTGADAAIYDLASIKSVNESSGAARGALVFHTLLNPGNLDERMRIDSSGNVGIGTSSPASTQGFGHLLEISDGDSGTSKDSALILSSWNGSSAENKWEIGNDTGGKLQFIHSVAGDGSTGIKMLIDSSGNVGIGTSSPSAKLDIKGNTTTWDGMAKIYLTDSNTNASSRNWSIGNGGSAFGALSFIVSNTKDGEPESTSGTVAMTIANAGDVTVSTGNLVIGTSGKGIDFSAYGAGTNIDSNLLDDYEEGTFTPAFGNGWGATGQIGRYTKIGNIVTCRGQLTRSDTSSDTNNLVINGFPFEVTNACISTAGNMWLDNGNNNDDFSYGAYINTAEQLYGLKSQSDRYHNYNDVNNNRFIYFHITYEVA